MKHTTWLGIKFHISTTIPYAGLIMCLFSTMGDTRFYHMLSNKEVYNGSLKIWHHYIRAFVHRKVYLSARHCKFNIHTLLQRAWTTSDIFIKFSKQKANTKVRQTNVKRASGQIFLEAIPGKLSKSLLKCNTYMCFYTWLFNINSKLSLVLKFQQLQFSSSVIDCFHGNLSIWGINYSKQCAHKKEELFYFCGSYSSLTIYPKSINTLFLKLFAGLEVKFYSNGFFEVMDEGFIVGDQLNSTNILQLSVLKV